MKKCVVVVLVLILVLMIPLVSLAHSGRTDSKGGHYDRQNGGYHYHHGYGAHQHPGGVCPYSKPSSSSNSSSSSSSSSGSTYVSQYCPNCASLRSQNSSLQTTIKNHEAIIANNETTIDTLTKDKRRFYNLSVEMTDKYNTLLGWSLGLGIPLVIVAISLSVAVYKRNQEIWHLNLQLKHKK